MRRIEGLVPEQGPDLRLNHAVLLEHEVGIVGMLLSTTVVLILLDPFADLPVGVVDLGLELVSQHR